MISSTTPKCPSGLLKPSIAVFVLFIFVNTVPAQTRIPDRGPRASQPFSYTDVDSVNLVNGNLMIALPLAALPQGRGESPDFPISLHYSSKLWDARREERFDGIPDENGSTRYFAELAVPSEHGGWQIGIGYRLIVRFRGDTEPMVPCDGSAEMQKNAYAVKTSLLFPDGTERELRPQGFRDVFGDGYFNVTPNGLVTQWGYATIGDGSGACRQTHTQAMTGGMTYFTSDGTYIRVTVSHVPGQLNAGRDNPWTMGLPDGTVVENLPSDEPGTRQRITDRNGNSARLKRGIFDGVESTIVEDDIGRQTVYQSTLIGDKVIQKGFRGERLETLIEWGVAHVRRVYNAADLSAVNAPSHMRSHELYQAMPVVRRVTLPTQLGGLAYEFSYNASDSRPDGASETRGWGELTSMVLPNGARIDYRYGLDELPVISTSLDLVRNSVIERSLNFLEEHDGQPREASERRRYAIGPDRSTVTDHDGTVTEARFVSADSATCESGTVFLNKAADGTLSEYLWTNGCHNRYTRAEFRSVPDATGAPILTAVTEQVLDRNGNVLERKEYDWVAYSSIPRTNGRVSGMPTGLRLLRRTINTYYNPAPVHDGSVETSPDRLRNVRKSVQVENGSGVVESYSEFQYDDLSARGNVVAARMWDSTLGPIGSADTSGFRLSALNSNTLAKAYDRFGNLVSTTDARGFISQVSFGQVDGVDGLYPTRKTDAVATSVSRSELFEYDLHTGLVTRSVAEGNSVAENIEISFDYDGAGRKVGEISGAGTPAESRTTFEYHDERRTVVIRSDVERAGDGRSVSVEHFDQLGRVRLSRTLDRPASQGVHDESSGIKVQRRYLKVEGVEYELTSSPYRAPTSGSAVDEASMSWRCKRSRFGGRSVETEVFEGAEAPLPWGGNSRSRGVSRVQVDGDKTLTTDEAGVRSVSRENALGSLTDLWEIIAAGDAKVSFGGMQLSGFRTSYAYDSSSNLLRVTQGLQSRVFVYDSLSRLTAMTHPESGTARFTHDANGNLRSRTDSRGVETYYFYDALNRLVNRSYTLSDKIAGYSSQPAVTYSYDDMSVPFARGRLTRVHTNVSDSRIRSFDPHGRIIGFDQLTEGRTFSSGYRFNLAGRLVEEVYPSGRVVKTAVDETGDVARVASGRNPSDVRRAYASAFQRDSSGNTVAVKYGNGLWEAASFNPRSSLTELTVGYSKGASSLFGLSNHFGQMDNGNVLRQNAVSHSGGIREQIFGYDGMNRLISAVESRGSTRSWSQSFLYDRFGNRSFAESGTTTLPRNCRSGTSQVVCSADRKRLNPSVSPATNRFIADQDGDRVEDYRYDPAGNILRDAFGDSFSYDGEGRQTFVRDTFGNMRAEYFYDGFGRRVKKVTYVNGRPDETTVFVYAPDGRTLGEYSDRAERHLGGKTLYATLDHLSSPRMFTDQFGKVANRHDYLPFGEEIADGLRVSDGVRKQYSGYERDTETGLDFAGARYYSSSLGRFTTPDPAKESMVPASPQSWNRYSYVLNNPLRFRDPSGELWVLNTGGDRVKNPYKWVDACSSGQTCWKSVALGTSDGVRVYGSRSANDISNYFANGNGQIHLEGLLSHHDSGVVSAAMSQRLPEPYLSIRAATALFNVGVRYRQRFTGDDKLVFTNGNASDGKPCNYPDGRACHSGHRGNDMDLRYMSAEGRALFGSEASAGADAVRTRFIVELFRRMGFPEAFSGDPKKLGTLPASSGNKRLHRNHLHVGVFDSDTEARPITRRRRRTR